MDNPTSISNPNPSCLDMKNIHIDSINTVNKKTTDQMTSFLQSLGK
jgi:hypothetical protein